jgi:hypothetical protein
MQKLAIHWTQSHVGLFLMHRLVVEVEAISESIICNAIGLNSIPNVLEVSASGLVLGLALHPASLLINGALLTKHPCFIENKYYPMEELVYFHIGARLFGWWNLQRILRAEEMSEGSIQLLVARSYMLGKKVIAMSVVNAPQLHLDVS